MITPEHAAPQVPARWIEGHYIPPMKAWTAHEARHFRHGGNRPPFRARIVTHCGDSIELIPVLTLYTDGQPQRWECYVPPGAEPCSPCEVQIDGDPDRAEDVLVHVAAERNPSTGGVDVWPALPRFHTPN